MYREEKRRKEGKRKGFPAIDPLQKTWASAMPKPVRDSTGPRYSSCRLSLLVLSIACLLPVACISHRSPLCYVLTHTLLPTALINWTHLYSNEYPSYSY